MHCRSACAWSGICSTSLGDFSLRRRKCNHLNAFVNRQRIAKGRADLDGKCLTSSYRSTLSYGSGFIMQLRSCETCCQGVSLGTDSASSAGIQFDRAPMRPAIQTHGSFTKLQGMLHELILTTDWIWKLETSGLATVRQRTRRTSHSTRFSSIQPIVRAALAADTNAQPILTYLATLLRAGTNATPYSMVTAAGAPWTPADLRDDEILVSQWLADDLQVKPGDEIALSYFLPESGAKLVEATNTFRVRSIVPMEMPWADRTLMPDFPGIEKAESTSEWDAGFPLTYKVRPKDEDYWKQHRGTPKAFITLAAGQKMWGNRFGNLTAIRFPIPTNATTALTPALSPGERENRSQSQSEPKTADSSTASEKSRDDNAVPSPRGRGSG